MRRPHALLAVGTAALCLTACAPGADKELKSTIDEVVPEQDETLGCEWQSNWGSGPDAKYYGCTYVVPGEPRSVSKLLRGRLQRSGFDVECVGRCGAFS